MMLEQVKVTPGELFEIMGLAQHATDRTRVECATVRGYLQIHLMRRFTGIHALIHKLPGRFQTKAKRKKVTGIHGVLLLSRGEVG
jgi:hypothetical protein